MLNKNDPLIGAVQQVIQKSNAEREAAKAVNEKFGITDRKALPHEKQGAWDAAYKQILSESADLAALAPPHNKVTKKDVLVGRGVLKKHPSKPGKHVLATEEDQQLNPYAVGMAAVKKSTGDEPPMEKKNIVKAHEIAKKIMKKQNMKEAVSPAAREPDSATGSVSKPGGFFRQTRQNNMADAMNAKVAQNARDAKLKAAGKQPDYNWPGGRPGQSSSTNNAPGAGLSSPTVPTAKPASPGAGLSSSNVPTAKPAAPKTSSAIAKLNAGQGAGARQPVTNRTNTVNPVAQTSGPNRGLPNTPAIASTGEKATPSTQKTGPNAADGRTSVTPVASKAPIPKARPTNPNIKKQNLPYKKGSESVKKQKLPFKPGGAAPQKTKVSSFAQRVARQRVLAGKEGVGPEANRTRQMSGVKLGVTTRQKPMTKNRRFPGK